MVPSNIKLAHGKVVQQHFFLFKAAHVPTQRKFVRGSFKVEPFLPREAPNLIFPHLRILNGSRQQGTLTKCRCLSALVNADGAVTSNWVPFIDQILLLATITLTYIAGVVPAKKALYNTRTSNSLEDMAPDTSSFSDSGMTSDDAVYLQFAWDVVKGKLTDSLSAIKNGIDLSGRVAEIDVKQQATSLCAVAEGPKIRLLWASFRVLKKQVENISIHYSSKSMNDFLSVFAEIIQKCYQPLFIEWLEEELCLVTSKPNKELLSSMVNNLNGYNSVIQSIRKSGKEDLYAELIYALKFDSSWKGGYYNPSLLSQHGVAILEDLLITLADGIASMYLELISVDSSLSNEMNNLGLSLCTLSTRALQRLRNEVALHQWLHQNISAIVSMYEDQFELRTLQSQLIEEPSRGKSENLKWWNKLSLSRSRLVSSSSWRFVGISHIYVSVKRTKELRALTGWRYYYSLFLELSDISMPFVRTVVAKVSDAISFFLVSLIGRSLGLIYSGIRQALRWK